MNFNALLFLVGYLVIFFGALSCAILWNRRKRRTRWPLPMDLKLLRMPGEFLWRRVIKNDESDMQWGTLVILFPILVGAATLHLVGHFLGSMPIIGLVVAVVIIALSMFLSIRWWQARLERRWDDYLGLFGERYVAEQLEPLKAEGWFIFHDVPCTGATGNFNLDHVAVGPGGIWVVETKTRRKRAARSGFKEHEVSFDGNQLVWPWGEDKESLKQASDNARWLRNWLEKMTGKVVDVAAVLAIPGYWVTERRLNPVRVANPKQLPKVLSSRGNRLLGSDEIHLFCRQLEAICRNVEF